MTHQPKGSMCISCGNANASCASRPFASMPVIKTYPDGVKAVKCTGHVHAQASTEKNAALQQGYDAARLEIDHLRGATKMVARWYMVDKDGVATLCTDMEDAEQEAKDANLAWPHRVPHRAVQLVEVGTSAVAGESCPTCIALARTVMLDQVSFDRKPDCYGIRQITNDEGIEEWEDIRTSPDVAREEANDMMATGRGEIYEVVPLWTTPQPSPAPQAADSVLEDATLLERERICAAIKAEDDYCVDQGNYMLDSDDCIKIVRGEWVRPDFSVVAARKQGANHD